MSNILSRGGVPLVISLLGRVIYSFNSRVRASPYSAVRNISINILVDQRVESLECIYYRLKNKNSSCIEIFMKCLIGSLSVIQWT